jgi:hypothetical protein
MRSTAHIRVLPFTAALLFTGTLLCPAGAEAQDAGKIGLALRAPQSVGVIFNVADGVALLPSVDFSWASSRSVIDGPAGAVPQSVLDAPAIEQSQAAVSVTLAARLRLAASDDTSLYVAPSFSRSLTSSKDNYFAATNAENDFSFGTHLGLQQTLTERFRVFGEVGARYRQYKITTDAGIAPGISETTTYKSVNTSAAVGILYYFK